MARLLPLLLAVAAFLIVAFLRQQAGRPRSDYTFRPRSRWQDPFGANPRRRPSGAGLPWTATRADVEGLRDAYSSAAIDPDASLARCGDCLAFYHASSVEALEAENGGRCALCGSDDLQPVRLV